MVAMATPVEREPSAISRLWMLHGLSGKEVLMEEGSPPDRVNATPASA